MWVEGVMGLPEENVEHTPLGKLPTPKPDTRGSTYQTGRPCTSVSRRHHHHHRHLDQTYTDLKA